MALKIHRDLNIESLFDKFATLPKEKKDKELAIQKQDKSFKSKNKK